MYIGGYKHAVYSSQLDNTVGVVVFYCCCNNYHKLHALNNTDLLYYSSAAQKSNTRSYQAKIKVSTGLCSFLEASLGESDSLPIPASRC